MDLNYMQYMTETDPLTLDQLMETYGQDVWNFAYLICKKRDLADDICQDVFVQAYRHAESFRGEASVKTWLLKITRNMSYNRRNEAYFRKVLLVDLVRSAGANPSAESAYMEQAAANDIWKAVFALPAKHREVILLDARHQLSISEIARILDVAEGTVKSRLHRAREKLSRMLRKEGLE